ncbi:MAG: HD domain-containing protein [Thiolinea sp.]
MSLSSNNIVPFIADIFYRRGAESYLGEQVTMSQHMLQAARLAELNKGSDLLIGAALLHDIGHYTNEFPEDALAKGQNNYHETAGAAVLEPFFPVGVVDCVRYHVAAKRYLCATDSEYYAGLSDASKHTLSLQGGAMDAAEVAEFQQLEHLEAIVNVRIWDDLGKDPNQETPDFSYYQPVLERLVKEHAEQ